MVGAFAHELLTGALLAPHSWASLCTGLEGSPPLGRTLSGKWVPRKWDVVDTSQGFMTQLTVYG